jgi:hypothetical protein
MVDMPSRSGREFDRRSLLRSGLLAGLGATALTVTAPGLTGVAQAAQSTVTLNGITYQAQNDWWWCRKCMGLFWSASGAPNGTCQGDSLATGTMHDPGGSSNYRLPHDGPSQNNPKTDAWGIQAGWAWCNYCQLVYWPVSGNFCPATADAHHRGSSTAYDMLFGGWGGSTPPQSGWRWCNFCQGFFWAHGSQNAGLCPVEGIHHVGSNTPYQVILP